MTQTTIKNSLRDLCHQLAEQLDSPSADVEALTTEAAKWCLYFRDELKRARTGGAPQTVLLKVIPSAA